uniref:Aerolysin-like C-terminal domain-containing protein n=2 Tax=Biomphalaria glabrata TaxID=6526 RepID=A0A2C9JBM4_BIOGL
MLLLNVCVSLTLIGLANALCAETSWWHSFDSAGQSKCDEANYYIKGLKRNDLLNDDQIFLLEGVLCCSAPSQWSNSELQVVYADWTRKWDRSEEWAYCPQGFFLQGMQRSTTGWPWYAGYLQNIENGRCAKPANHPFYYGHCYVKIIEFNSNGMFSCQDDYYITGLYKSDCGYLHCIDKLYCCKMATGPEVIDNADKVKTKIMETTLFNLANLADKLGYGWCYGTKGVNVGEDFYRSGDSWIADRRLFWPNRWCDGYMCNERLAIDYTGWTLAVKEIIYGESVIDELQPETVHTGVRYNHLNESSSATFEYSRDVTETVEHSTTSSWSISVGMSFSLEFQINKLTQASETFRTAFEYSRSSTNTNSQMRTDTLRTSSTQTIPPRSAARYSVMVGKTRTTIPYTAVIIAKFNVRFRGFLRWGGGFSGSTKNYHYQHKGSGDRPSVPYTFGDQSQP